VLIESYRPGVAKRIGVGYEELSAHQSAPRLLLDQRLRAGRSLRRGWAGHDINYLAMGGFLACSGRDADGRPRCRAPRWPTAPAAACTQRWPIDGCAGEPLARATRGRISTSRSPTACST
jgi:crotonobetainyl-CoA:carnitine CoA-transferase CaiB-like acyl-CoA transferase